MPTEAMWGLIVALIVFIIGLFGKMSEISTRANNREKDVSALRIQIEENERGYQQRVSEIKQLHKQEIDSLTNESKAFKERSSNEIKKLNMHIKSIEEQIPTGETGAFNLND